jgi:hypothetical protein
MVTYLSSVAADKLFKSRYKACMVVLRQEHARVFIPHMVRASIIPPDCKLCKGLQLCWLAYHYLQ